MCSCPGPARTPACTPSSAPNPKAPASWTCRIGTSPTATCNSRRPCLGPAGRPWPSTPPAVLISSNSRPVSCGPSETGCDANSTRPPATAAASWAGPPLIASRPSRRWPPISSPPVTSRPTCFAGCAAAMTTRPAYRVGWRWPPSRPTGPTIASGRCVSSSSAVPAGWLEANAHLGPQYRQVVRALAWQRHATGLAIEQERPGYVMEALGPVPESTRGRRAWRQAAAEIEHYRRSYQITDPERALGPDPAGPAQRADRPRVRTAIERVHVKQRATDRARDIEPTSERPSQPRPHERRGRSGPERAAG